MKDFSWSYCNLLITLYYFVFWLILWVICFYQHLQFVSLMKLMDDKLIDQAKKTKGYLHKKSSGYFASWQKRYYIIFENKFCSYLDQTLQVEKKSIQLIDIICIDAEKMDEFVIKTKSKTFLFKSSSQNDRDLWIASLTLLKDLQNKKIQQKSKELQKKKQEGGEKRKNVSKIKNFKKSVAEKYQNNFKISQETQKLKLQKNQTELMIFFSKIGLNKMIHRLKEDSIKKRIIFIQDKKGYYFSLSSKSVYKDMVDEFLLKQITISPYQINVLYFMDRQFQLKALMQICKFNEILQCSLIQKNTIKVMIDCKKSIQIQPFLADEEEMISNLSFMNKAIQISKEFWNQNGRLQKNIDLFLYKYRQSEQNQPILSKMVENQFNFSINNAIGKSDLSDSNEFLKSQATLKFFPQFDSICSTLSKFTTACIIKNPPEKEVKQKFIKIYHRFVYNYLNKKWAILCTVLKDNQLIQLTNKVFIYNQIIEKDLLDERMKQGCKVLVKIVLRNSKNEIYTNIEKVDMNEESLRIERTLSYKFDDSNEKPVTIFVSSILDCFMNSLSTKMILLSKIQKDQTIISIIWEYFQSISKKIIEKISNLIQFCNEKSTLISVCNSSKLFKQVILIDLYKKLQKTPLFSIKRVKEQFLRQLQIDLSHCQTLCIKKLFIITFSSIDRNLLKNDFDAMSFKQICRQVIYKIQILQNILPDVKVSMYEAAFEQVCFFFYTCIVKQNNMKNKSKETFVKVISSGIKDINDQFRSNISECKINNLLRDLSLLKDFIIAPQSSLKSLTRELKKVFGTSFSEGNLKNLISMRVNNIKQRQFLYEDCRQQVKSSYNSNQEMESFQRESFFNSSYRRERKSTLTQSLNSYCQQQEKSEIHKKTEKNVFLGLSNVLKEGYLYRKKVMKNANSLYVKYFFRIIKDKIFQYETQNSQQSLNCYLLNQMKKIYLVPQKNSVIVMEFQQQTIRMKAVGNQEALHWIQKVYEAMSSDKAFSPSKDEVLSYEYALFEDFSGQKKFLSTKQTKQTFLSSHTPKKSSLRKKYISPQKKNEPNQKQSNYKESKQSPQKYSKAQLQKQKSIKGCGGCSFFF